MQNISRRSQRGLSLVELMALVAVMAVIAILFLPALSHRHPPAYRIKCVSNLKNVGLAFRIFATDNNDLFPAAVMISNGTAMANIDAMAIYRALSNELSTPSLLYCAKDAKRKKPDPRMNFDTITAMNISYFASLSASETNPAGILAGDRNLMTNGRPVGPGTLGLKTNMVVSWSKEIHEEQGNIAMADGSVQQFNNLGSRLNQAVAEQGVATNWLAFP